MKEFADYFAFTALVLVDCDTRSLLGKMLACNFLILPSMPLSVQLRNRTRVFLCLLLEAHFLYAGSYRYRLVSRKVSKYIDYGNQTT